MAFILGYEAPSSLILDGGAHGQELFQGRRANRVYVKAEPPRLVEVDINRMDAQARLEHLQRTTSAYEVPPGTAWVSREPNKMSPTDFTYAVHRALRVVVEFYDIPTGR